MKQHIWKDSAACLGLDTNIFFEKYEEDQAVAVVVDNICLTCPVIIDCFNHGTTNGEWGVWGGVYLVDGEINAIKNAHKTPEIWKELLAAVGTDDEVY